MGREEWENAFRMAVDIGYSHDLAKRMEGPRTNPVLGYRTAGSHAEQETGNMILEEMRRLGLSDVHKDEISVDSWEFERAVMRFTDREGKVHEFQLGAYQTEFHTRGFEEFPVIYVGKGTALAYRDLDVEGKLVLVDINQRDEWWINFPVYQAYLKGAAALIAVQEQGYGEINESALNAQDIAGPRDAAAFSVSQADAALLREAMGEAMEVKVLFDASSTVSRDKKTYNIVGSIPGADPEAMILLSAHYDSYFSGFQDDNAAVAMMLGIARTLLQIGYRPDRTLVFCAMAAEEWGVVDSKYDWSTGAYEQIFTARPEWQGRVMADLNFELPAHAHGRRDAIRCTYEYKDFMEHFIEGVQVDREAYPDGLEVRCPIQTWSDDFSMAIAGIPSMVNDFSEGAFMETHYHSQFDTENFYQEPVYRFHHELYGSLVMALDRTAALPMDFGELFRAVRRSVDLGMCRKAGADSSRLFAVLEEAIAVGGRLYGCMKDGNERHRQLLEAGREREAEAMAVSLRPINRSLLHIFRKEQDYFVRLNWHDEVLFPQEAVQNNLSAIFKALEALEAGDVPGSLDAVYEIDNNRYAFLFDEEVFRHFTEYVLDQPEDRLKWGAGRIVHHANLFRLVSQLKGKLGEEEPDLETECRYLSQAADRQMLCYRDDMEYMASSVEKLTAAMKDCLKLLQM